MNKPEAAASPEEQHVPRVEVRHLKKYFPIRTGFVRKTDLKAVDDISFTIEKGETLGIVGESGCGKTTLGRCVLRLEEPTAGDIFYEGSSIMHADMNDFRQKMQIVFQDPYASLDPRKTVSAIIGEAMDIKKMYPNAAERRDHILELMELVGLNQEFYNRFPHEFSGGQRQRIGIARALAMKPGFIVCDEPVSALDVSIQAQIINTLEDLQKSQQLSYLFIAHDLAVVRHISTRVGVMYLGHMVELVSSKELYRNPLHPYTEMLLSAIPVANPDLSASRSRIKLTGEIPSPMNPPSGCPFRTRCPRAGKQCSEQMPALKEVQPGHFVACHLV
ncbi:MAG: dipeptide ABC transporter ATP-binding protein [Lachnospiraceae bacterium]|nr:dipeptide ABC transporter ATP-binding protein [Lachnospiraceae bacterium]